jgi:hypothetical protein
VKRLGYGAPRKGAPYWVLRRAVSIPKWASVLAQTLGRDD